jgi:hypothetical protein
MKGEVRREDGMMWREKEKVRQSIFGILLSNMI